MKIIAKFLGGCIILFFLIGAVVTISDEMQLKRYKYEGVKFKIENNAIEKPKLISKISSTDKAIFDLLLTTGCLEYGSSLRIHDGKYNSDEIIIVKGYLGEDEDNNTYAIYRSESIRHENSEWQYYKLNNSVPTKIDETELNEKGFQRYKNNRYDNKGDIIPVYIKEEQIRLEEEYANMPQEEKERLNTTNIINSIIKKELGSQINNTTLTSITVNENLGTEIKNDVIVLANLSWSVKNREETTREMLEMYSDHLAVTLAPNLENGSEIALFWNATYTGLNIKHSYYIENGNAYKQ